MAEPNPDVIKRLAESINKPGAPAPSKATLSPEQERRFAEGDVARRASVGAFGAIVSNPADRAQIPAADREVLIRRAQEHKKEQERQRVLAALRRYWYGPDVMERLAASIESEPLPADVVPQVDVGEFEPIRGDGTLKGGGYK